MKNECVVIATAALYTLPCLGVTVDVRVELQRGGCFRGESVLLRCTFLSPPAGSRPEVPHDPASGILFSGRFKPCDAGVTIERDAVRMSLSTLLYAPSSHEWFEATYVLPTASLPTGRYELILQPRQRQESKGALMVRTLVPSSFSLEIVEPATPEERAAAAIARAQAHTTNVRDWRLDLAERELLGALKEQPTNGQILRMTRDFYLYVCAWDRALQYTKESMRMVLGTSGPLAISCPGRLGLYAREEFVKAALRAGVAADEADAARQYDGFRRRVLAQWRESIEARRKIEGKPPTPHELKRAGLVLEEDATRMVNVEPGLPEECLNPFLAAHTLPARPDWWPGFALGLGAGALLTALCYLAARLVRRAFARS